jgi:hypothetical protein
MADYLAKAMAYLSERKRAEQLLQVQRIGQRLNGIQDYGQQNEFLAAQDPRIQAMYGGTPQVTKTLGQQLEDQQNQTGMSQLSWANAHPESPLASVLRSTLATGKVPNKETTEEEYMRGTLTPEDYVKHQQVSGGLLESANNAADNAAAMERERAGIEAQRALRAAQEAAARANANESFVHSGLYGEQTRGEKMKNDGTFPYHDKPATPKQADPKKYADGLARIDRDVAKWNEKLTRERGKGEKANPELVKLYEDNLNAKQRHRLRFTNGTDEEAPSPVVTTANAPSQGLSPDIEQKISVATQTVNPQTGKNFTRDEVIAYLKSKGLI